MTDTKQQLLDANDTYAKEFGDKAELPMPPGRHFAILTCIDARLDPAKFAGFAEGDAHVFRNAGGRATDDAIRSLVVSHKLLGTTEWFVVHHTDCGMEYFEDDDLAGLLDTSLTTAEYDGKAWNNRSAEGGSPEGHYVRWLSISDPQQAVVEDVRRLRNHPLVSPKVTIHGFIFDVKTGRLIEIEEASRIGQTT